MNGFSMSLQTTLSRKTPVAKIANIHLELAVTSGALFIRGSDDVSKKGVQKTIRTIDMLFFLSPGVVTER